MTLVDPRFSGVRRRGEPGLRRPAVSPPGSRDDSEPRVHFPHPAGNFFLRTADPDVNKFNIDVDVLQGVVTLSGTVETDDVRQHAEDIASRTEGVADVVLGVVVPSVRRRGR